MAIIVDQSMSGVETMQRGAFRTQATRFMRTRMGGVGNRWANWGLAGVRHSFTEGAASAFGFYKSPTGGYKFMQGVTKRGLMGLGVGAGVGAAVYAATDNPLLGVGAGVGATWAAKSTLRGAAGAGMKLMGPLFIGAGMVEGYKQEGMWGAAKGAAVGAAEWGLWSVGFKALSVAFKGSLSGLGTTAAAVAWPLAVVAGIGYGIYKGTQYFSERGREAVRSEFAGDTAAFQTQAAYSMRQRAMQEISRSHTNSRTILGNEAQLMHLR